MARTTATPATEPERKKRKRGALIKFTFAGVALLGIGAAATSAAWTDDAWFTTSATASTVKLDASLDGTTFIPADTSATGVAVAIPTSVFGLVNQGSTITTTVYLRNAGTAPLTLGPAAITTTGTMFAAGSGVTVTAVPASTTLAPLVPSVPANTTAVLVTLTTPAAWPTSYQGSTGVITIKFTGQS